MKQTKHLFLAVICALLFNGCDIFGLDEVSIEDTKVGDGLIGVYDVTWKIHLKGTLKDGTVFLNTTDTSPMLFVNNGYALISGINEGIQGMKIGGKRVLTIPPSLAYGKNGLLDSNGKRVVPKNATVIFEVEFLDMPQLITEDIVSGTPGTEAQAGDYLTVKYKGTLEDGTVFDQTTGDKTFSFTLGNRSVISGWEFGVQGMRVGGKRKLIIPPHLGYGFGDPQTTPKEFLYGNLIFEVELVKKG